MLAVDNVSANKVSSTTDCLLVVDPPRDIHTSVDEILVVHFGRKCFRAPGMKLNVKEK